MKKLFILMLVLCLFVFSACGADTASVDEEVLETKTDIKEEKDTQIKEQEEKEEEIALKIDSSWMSLLGLTRDEIEAKKGNMTESLWADGPLYRFGEENIWYAFSEYDFAEDNSYIPLGVCTGVSVPLGILMNADSQIGAQELENAMGKLLTEEFDEMYETNVYAASYKGCTFDIYENSYNEINQNSVVNIKEN